MTAARVRIKFPHVQHRSTGAKLALVVTTNDQGQPLYNAVGPGEINKMSRGNLLDFYHPADQEAFRIFRELISIPKP